MKNIYKDIMIEENEVDELYTDECSYEGDNVFKKGDVVILHMEDESDGKWYTRIGCLVSIYEYEDKGYKHHTILKMIRLDDNAFNEEIIELSEVDMILPMIFSIDTTLNETEFILELESVRDIISKIYKFSPPVDYTGEGYMTFENFKDFKDFKTFLGADGYDKFYTNSIKRLDSDDFEIVIMHDDIRIMVQDENIAKYIIENNGNNDCFNIDFITSIPKTKTLWDVILKKFPGCLLHYLNEDGGDFDIIKYGLTQPNLLDHINGCSESSEYMENTIPLDIFEMSDELQERLLNDAECINFISLLDRLDRPSLKSCEAILKVKQFRAYCILRENDIDSCYSIHKIEEDFIYQNQYDYYSTIYDFIKMHHNNLLDFDKDEEAFILKLDCDLDKGM